ncbi:hypothetical protein BOTBODRAFT_33922 [Botryobasidium botryosum FD-172 SS1]|uniref:RING-type domain-containing protein n=1 Tax=Botryobasidium botryosum (strain FD-172 SS1) TaxID=930990 RepID=A0A067MMD4_BOTB1|nr:hypothetical protein BOTBODRAFT_33922 [Botryobasidium botryosum FD-172 SS1]
MVRKFDFKQPSTWGRSQSSSSNNSGSQKHNNHSPPVHQRDPAPLAYRASSAFGSSPHPYASMPAAPQPVVASHDATEDEGECPVCLEPLSFSFRLPGEKPHIIPECGHALHEVCFAAVYGAPAQNRSAGVLPRKSNLGVCGVCRRPMKVGDGDGGRSNKLAALTGMGDKFNTANVYPGREPTPYHSGPSSGRRSASTPTPATYDPNEDDPLDGGVAASMRSGHSSDHSPSGYIVAPSIQVRAEYNSISRSGSGAAQPLTCIVVVELASRRTVSGSPFDNYPVHHSLQPPSLTHLPSLSSVPHSRQTSDHLTSPVPSASGHSSPHPDVIHEEDEYQYNARPSDRHSPDHGTIVGSHRQNSKSQSTLSTDGGESIASSQPAARDSAFARITEDLAARIHDWKGHPISGLGPLLMFDILSVRRDTLVREFLVYLFREAIICVLEEKKRVGLGRLLSSAQGAAASFGAGAGGGAGGGADPAGGGRTSMLGDGLNVSKGVLRLKGRIYIRHIKRVLDTSVKGEKSLTIDMEDERLESFILIFKEQSSLDRWKKTISDLVSNKNGGSGASTRSHGNGNSHGNSNNNGAGNFTNHNVGSTGALADMDEFGGRSGSKPSRALSGVSHDTNSTGTSNPDSLLGGASSGRSTMSSAVSGVITTAQYLKKLGSDGEVLPPQQIQSPPPQPTYMSPPMPGPSTTVTPHIASSPSNSLTPIPHTPLDLIVVISLPHPQANAATSALKIRVIKDTLDFLIASLASKDRLSLVTFQVGAGGRVRKTPFLSVGRHQSRTRLMRFVDLTATEGMNGRGDETPLADEFLVRGKEDKIDVVTAVNYALDIVLQRKARNPVSGMLLVSDASDSTRRAQMDLVLARAEAANIPIHSFGYGRAHDPAALWLISNHTSGTYTFVKDWYELRDCVAGCVGGLMSIGLTNMKLHLKIVDVNRFRIRKLSGGPQSIVSSNGRDVDIDIGELRYGERKEMLVELELDSDSGASRHAGEGSSSGRRDGESSPNATDQFVQRMGLDALSISDSVNLVDGMMDRMIDEVPVLELDGSFFDPAASKNVSRLAHPVLLTVTLLPPSTRPNTPALSASDPVIVRRRMELLASDMITRALVLISRKNVAQAQRVLAETKRILHKVLQTISQSLPPPSSSTVRSRKDILTLAAVRTLQSMLQDIQVLTDAIEENPDLFAHDHRNFGAQQAMILRDQKSWSGRTATEKLFWTADSSIDLVARSSDWVAHRD